MEMSDSRDSSGKGGLKQILLMCGILSSFLYVWMNIYVSMQWDSYNSASQTISELSAVGAPARTLWVLLGIPYTLLMAAFGWGIRLAGNNNHHLRTTGNLMVAYGITGLGWPLAPMHLREVLASGGETLSDTMHIVFTMVTVLLMLFAMGFGARAFGKGFRNYTILTMITLAIFGSLTSMDAPGVNANLSTPLIGVWERINIGVFLLWIIVLAVILLRRENGIAGNTLNKSDISV